MGKVDAKSLHRSGKVPLCESAKVCATTRTEPKQRKVSTCSICRSVGHRANTCGMPPDSKRRSADLIDFDMNFLECADSEGLRRIKRRNPMDMVDIDDWI